jgi:DNA polymerase III epsilon subunit-like protein
MKVLVFDTETTGLPASYNSPLTDVSKWPHIVQLSFIVFDTVSKEILEYSDYIIKLEPDIVITPESVAIHQITMEQSQRDGIPIQVALQEFNNAVKDVGLVVGHNIQFDKNMLAVEFQRNKMKNSLYRDGRPLNEFCTMKQTVSLCKLPFLNKNNNAMMSQFKWPTLSELHRHLFGATPKGTHNAIVDVMICLRCYVHLEHLYDIAFDDDVKIVFRILFKALL